MGFIGAMGFMGCIGFIGSMQSMYGAPVRGLSGNAAARGRPAQQLAAMLRMRATGPDDSMVSKARPSHTVRVAR